MINILFVTGHSPFKTNTGANQRTFFLCSSFSKFSHVDVLALEQDMDFDIVNCSKIDISNYLKNNNLLNSIKYILLLLIPPVFVTLYTYTNKFLINILGIKNIKLSKTVKKLLKNKKYDFIFVRTIKNMILFGIKPNRNIILDIDDLPEQIYQSKIHFLKNRNSIKAFFYKLYYSLCVIKYRNLTKKILNKVFTAYLPNKQQCSLLNNTVYLPNIPFIHEINTEKTQNKNQILFVGMIEYEPNYTGIEYFLENIFPLILKKYPYVILNIIGIISDNRKSEWQNNYKTIKISGFVNDLVTEYKKSSLVIVPVYNGGGTNIKVIEAMSLGKACVISSFAARGFEDILKDGKNIFIANNDFDFADKAVKLLENSELRENMGKNAKEAVNNNYSYDNFSDIIYKSLNN